MTLAHAAGGRKGWAYRALLCLSVLAVLMGALSSTWTAAAARTRLADICTVTGAWSVDADQGNDGDLPAERLHDGSCSHCSQAGIPGGALTARPDAVSEPRFWPGVAAETPITPIPPARPPRA